MCGWCRVLLLQPQVTLLRALQLMVLSAQNCRSSSSS